VLTYLVALASWGATALGLLAPWLVQLLAPANDEFWPGERVVAPLAFAAAIFAGYIVVSIGVGRARRTGFNWVITGTAAIANVALNILLVPEYGMEGAAAAAVVSFAMLFAGMALHAQRVYPVPYQWRRVATALAAGVALVIAARALEAPLWVSILLVPAYPVALLALGFYLPAERSRLRALIPLARAR
jgi:O-antigen/teichoic acid export membrane protein